MLQTFEIIWTLFTKILLNFTLYDSSSPFSFSFCIQVQTVKTLMKCCIRWHFIRICTAICCTEKHNFIYFTYPLQYIFRMKRVNLQHSRYSLQPCMSFQFYSGKMWILIRRLHQKPAALDPQCYQKGCSNNVCPKYILEEKTL